MVIASFARIARIIAILALMCACPAAAQNYEKIQPQIPPPSPSQLLLPPEPAEKDSDKIAVPYLKGIKLVDDVKKIVREGQPSEGVSEDGLSLLLDDPALAAKLEDFIGKPLTFRDMEDISKSIVDWYRKRERPFVDVVFPEQDISKGTLQAVVMEFHVGAITVTGNQLFSDDDIRSGLRLNPGDTIDYRNLQEDLAWINQNPFRSVNAVFGKGDEVGTTNLDLETADQLPVRVYAGYDNTGTPNIGRSRYNLGVNWGNAFWANQMLSYQFTSSSNFWLDDGRLFGNPNAANFTGHSVDDIIPLAWHDKIDIFGAYTNETPQVAAPFNQQGFSAQASLRYIHTLPSFSWLNHEIQGGYDYKQSNNNLEFGGTQVFTGATEISQFLLIYAGDETDSYGELTFKNSLALSPGGMTGDNTTTAFEQSGSSSAHSSYIYDNLKLTRTMPIDSIMDSVTRFVAQVSSGNLLPSEEISAGGENTVRGYNEEQALGAQGILLSEELRSPSFSLTKDLLPASAEDKAQALVFLDYGQVGDVNTQPNQPDVTYLAGTGIGFRYAIGSTFNLNADYGWQLIRPPGSPNLGSLAHVSLTVSY